MRTRIVGTPMAGLCPQSVRVESQPCAPHVLDEGSGVRVGRNEHRPKTRISRRQVPQNHPEHPPVRYRTGPVPVGNHRRDQTIERQPTRDPSEGTDCQRPIITVGVLELDTLANFMNVDRREIIEPVVQDQFLINVNPN